MFCLDLLAEAGANKGFGSSRHVEVSALNPRFLGTLTVLSTVCGGGPEALAFPSSVIACVTLVSMCSGETRTHSHLPVVFLGYVPAENQLLL